MTWETFWTVTGIVYTTYYTLNMAYDVFVYYRHKKKETSTIDEVSSLFENGIKPTVVNRELYEPNVVVEIAIMPSIQIDKYQQELERMKIEAFLKDVNRVNSSIVSDIYS
jgi:hypothetical protein